MKKTYVKPQVYFESFQLSANVAGGCNLISNQSQNQCPYTDPELGVTFFATAPSPCTYTPGPNDKKPCYNVPDSGATIFTS